MTKHGKVSSALGCLWSAGLLAVAVMGVEGCREGSTREGDVCDLADGFGLCNQCVDGETTCTYEDVSVTSTSCDECQARSSLYGELCDDGVEASAADVEDGTFCTTLPLWFP